MSNNVSHNTLIDRSIALLGVVVAWCLPVMAVTVCALIGVSSLGYVSDSWSALETSPEPGGLPLVYVLKTLIPTMAVLLGLQAIAQIGRGLNVLCHKDPS